MAILPRLSKNKEMLIKYVQKLGLKNTGLCEA